MPREQLGSQGPGYPGLPGRVKPSGGQGARNGLVSRPELEVFGLAMLGGGMVFGAAHAYGKPVVVVAVVGGRTLLTEIDYPWGTLGEATVVDVGGGVGQFSLSSFPSLPLSIYLSSKNLDFDQLHSEYDQLAN